MNYEIRSIDYQDCKEWFLKKHYAKRIPPIDFCFGLYDKDILVGICSYGTPVSHPLRSIFTDYKLYELNRLVINENMPKNTLSFIYKRSPNLFFNHCTLFFWPLNKLNYFEITK